HRPRPTQGRSGEEQRARRRHPARPRLDPPASQELRPVPRPGIGVDAGEILVSLAGDYFDLQVNGYGGIDFNQDELSDEQLHAACEKLRADGVGGILATIITENVDVMCMRLARLASSRNKHALARELIQGIHIEGPFLNETTGYRGAHPADAIKPANLDDAKRLFDSSGGLLRLFTLAPERDPNLEVTSWLTKQGVAVSAGH